MYNVIFFITTKITEQNVTMFTHKQQQWYTPLTLQPSLGYHTCNNNGTHSLTPQPSLGYNTNNDKLMHHNTQHKASVTYTKCVYNEMFISPCLCDCV